MEAQGVEEKKVRKMLVLIESLRSKISENGNISSSKAVTTLFEMTNSVVIVKLFPSSSSRK